MYLVPYYFIHLSTWVFNTSQHMTGDGKDKANWTPQKAEKRKHYSHLKITLKGFSFPRGFPPFQGNHSPASFLTRTGQFRHDKSTASSNRGFSPIPVTPVFHTRGRSLARAPGWDPGSLIREGAEMLGNGLGTGSTAESELELPDTLNGLQNL